MDNLSPETVAAIGGGGVISLTSFFVLLWRLVSALNKLQLAIGSFVTESNKTFRRHRLHVRREETHHKAEIDHQKRVEDLLERIELHSRSGVPRPISEQHTPPPINEPRWDTQTR